MFLFSIFSDPHLSFPHNLLSFLPHKIQFVLIKYSCMCGLPLRYSWLMWVYTFRENGPYSHQPTIANSSLGQSGYGCETVLSMLWFGLLGLSWVMTFCFPFSPRESLAGPALPAPTLSNRDPSSQILGYLWLLLGSQIHLLVIFVSFPFTLTEAYSWRWDKFLVDNREMNFFINTTNYCFWLREVRQLTYKIIIDRCE